MPNIKFILFNLFFYSLTVLLYCPPTTAQYNYASESYQKEQVNTNSKLKKEKWKSLSKGYDYSNEKEKKAATEEENTDVTISERTTSQKKVPTFAGEVLKYSLFGLVILVLAFIVIRLIAGGSVFGNKKVEKEKIFTLEDIEDNLHEVDVESFLNNALLQRDFRLAIRLYYLAILKELSLSGKILWKKDKTNGVYLREMYSHPNITDFRETTYIYEYVWFNETMPFGTDDFEKARPVFRNMLNIAEQSPIASPTT